MKKDDKIEIHYLKSPHFKTFFASGAFGGISPTGHISMAFYVDRAPIPQKAVYSLQDGKLGAELKDLLETKHGVAREIDCNILFDLATAKNIRNWLDNNIKGLEELEKNVTK